MSGRWVTVAVVVLGVLLAGLPAGAPAEEPTGLAIMQTQRRLHRVRDSEEIVLMKVVGRHGDVKERRLATYTLIGPDDLSKLLIRFLAPRDVQDTGLLTWEHADGDDDQWLYLPASRRVKRIASSARKTRFMGTDFAYEDLRPEALALHRYTLVGSESLDGRECFVVEAVPATPRQAADSGYGKRRLWIGKAHHVTLRIEYYDKRGRLAKIATARNVVNVTGTVWRADETEMRDVQGGTRTVMIVERRRLDTGLGDSFFTETELRRGGD